jgi:hypothetical protein
MRKRETFMVQFTEYIKSEGWISITDFVNDWIKKGGTFQSLHQHLILKDIVFTKETIWANLRKHLTIPYDSPDYFWYKWDSIAKTKGFNSFLKLYEVYKRKLTTAEMAIELGVDVRTVEVLLNRMEGQNKRKGRHKDEQGFCKTNVKEKWNKLLKEHGFDTLKEAWDKHKSLRALARALGVKESALWLRLSGTKIKFRKYYQKKKKKKIVDKVKV